MQCSFKSKSFIVLQIAAILPFIWLAKLYKTCTDLLLEIQCQPGLETWQGPNLLWHCYGFVQREFFWLSNLTSISAIFGLKCWADVDTSMTTSFILFLLYK